MKQNKKSSIDRISALNKEAIALGVDKPSLQSSMGSIESDHYETYLRVQAEKAFRMTKSAHRYSIAAAVAAVVSALAAIFMVFFSYH